MKKLLFCVVALAGLYQGWHRFGPAESLGYTPGSPYVVVYGRDSCGFTAQARAGLSRQGIVFSYRSVDDAAVADGLHGKMETLGISTRRYDLPVIEVNGQLLVRPDIEQVAQVYRGG